MSKATIHPAVQSTIDALFPSLLLSSPEDLNTSYLAANPTDPCRILGAAQGSLQLALSTSSESPIAADSCAVILALLAKLAEAQVGSTVQHLSAALEFAESPAVGASTSELEGLREAYKGRMPLAWDLRGRAEKDARVKEMEAQKGKEELGKADV